MILAVFIIFIIFFIVIIIPILTVAHIRMNRDDIGVVQPYSSPVLINNVSTMYLDSAWNILNAWTHIIGEANKNIIVSTYRWRVDKININYHIIAFGIGLKKLQNRNVKPKITILTNQFKWIESNNFMEDNISRSLAIWEKMGIEDLSNIQFCVYANFLPNNIHSKFICVDNRYTCIHSLNVESYSHGGKGTWGEIGALFDNPIVTQNTREFFNVLMKDSYTVSKRKQMTITDINLDERSLTELIFHKTDQVNIIHQIANPYRITRTTELIHSLVYRIQQTNHSIHILTPNLNDISIIKSLKKLDSDIKIMLMHSFNIDLPILQKYIVGWENNHQILKKLYKTNIKIKWYGKDMNIIKGKVEDAVHAKLIIIDGMYTSIGSCNLDTYSTLNSFETTAWIKDSKFAESASKTFQNYWKSGISIF